MYLYIDMRTSSIVCEHCLQHHTQCIVSGAFVLRVEAKSLAEEFTILATTFSLNGRINGLAVYVTGGEGPPEVKHSRLFPTKMFDSMLDLVDQLL